MAIFDVDDLRIAYDRHDHASAGRAVVFLHAFPLNRLMWEPQVEQLGGSYDMIVPDMRGLGASDITNGTTTMERMADDVHAIVTSLEVAPVVLVGLSMGGYVALAYARKYVDEVRGLVLANTRASADSEQVRAGRYDMIREVTENGPAAIAAAMLPKLLSPKAIEERAPIAAEVTRMIETTSPAGIAGALAGMAERPDSTDLLASLDVPTLVVASTLDAVVSEAESQRMAESISGARFVVIPDAGHLSNLEQPEVFNEILGEFLESL